MTDQPTIEWVKARCREDCDCWLWKLSLSPQGLPRFSTRNSKRSNQVRRVVWAAAKGQIPAKRVVTVTCPNKTCLNPEHLALTTKAAVIRRTSAQANVKAKKVAAGLKSRTGPVAKLDMDKARYIRTTDKTLTAVAGELGVSIALASKVRRGEAWKETGNPFAGLMALGA